MLDAARRASAALATSPAARVVLGLLVGGAGGVVAHWLHVPLAFMLGALFACMVASLLRAPVEVPLAMRSWFMALIGLFLGEAFDAAALERMAAWPATVAMAILYVPVASYLAYLFYARFAGLDRLTALFSAIPGGLSAVVLFSDALGADERRVALTQSLRVAIVVVTAPAVAFGLLGFDAPDLFETTAPPMTWREAAILAATAAAAIWALRRMGAPIPFLVAPLLASGALRLAGVVEGALPAWLVEVALVVVGASIGCRFRGARPAMLARLAGWTLLGTIGLMAIAAVFAAIAAAAFGADMTAALLAFAPGGVAEMCLIAIAIDADPGFVATHHIARILFILLATPIFAAWLKRSVAARGVESGGA